MQKLVLLYNINGGYDCGNYNVTVPMVYSSKKDLLNLFEEKVLSCWLLFKEQAEKEKEWFKKEPLMCNYGKNIEKYKSALCLWRQQKPKEESDPNIFKINDVEFNAIDFVFSGEYVAPTIMTVDEWFDTAIGS